MTTRIPFTERYSCPLYKKVVVVKGMTADLYDGGNRVASEQTATRCSGPPNCGCMLKQRPCPYPDKATTP
jgi:hypothetical protein